MGAIESVHNDQNQPVEVWWDLLDGQVMNHHTLQPQETKPQELMLSLLHKICVKQQTQVVCKDLFSPALAGNHVTYQVSNILSQAPIHGSRTILQNHTVDLVPFFLLIPLFVLVFNHLRRKRSQKSDGPRELEESLMGSEGQTGGTDKTRFICACIGAVFIHLTLGTFYSWGNITPYVTSYLKSQGHDVSYGETSFVLAGASFFQGMSMFFGGKLHSKLGLRGTALLGGGVLSLGTALSFFTIRYGLLPFMFTYSAMFGTGIGLAYTAPLVTLMGWLPNNKGLASGIVVGGFGMGSFLFSFVQKAWVNASGLAPNLKVEGLMYYSADAPILNNVPSLFLCLASCYFTMQVIGVALLYPAPPSLVRSRSSFMDQSRQFSASQMVRTWSFWIIAGCFFFNQQVNIFFSSFEQVFGASLLQGGVSTQFLTVMAACASICNGAGRIVWGSLSDKYSFKTAITSLCAIQVVLAATISLCSTEEMYFVWVCGILFNVGGFYALFPASCAMYFGQANVGSNYGILSIAPGVSALWSAFLAAELTQIFPVVYLTFLVAALEFGAFMCAVQIPKKPETAPGSMEAKMPCAEPEVQQEFTMEEAESLNLHNQGSPGQGSQSPYQAKGHQAKGHQAKGQLLENPRESVASGNGTFASSVFLLFNSAVGQGVLTLPYCCLVAGIVPTTVAIFFFAVVTCLSSIAIVISQDDSNSSDYQYIVKKLLGPKASYAMSFNLALYCLLNCVGALIIVADNVKPVLIHFFGNQDVWWMQRETLILAGSIAAFPLMCFREITSLQHTALVALVVMMYIVCVVVQQAITQPTEKVEEYGQLQGFVPSWSIIQALPLVCLAFQNQMQVPSIFAELHPKIKTVRKMSMAIIASYCIIVPMYLATAFGGYYMFRSATTPDILDSPYDQNTMSVFVARLFVALVAILRVPVNHHTARSALFTLWESSSLTQPHSPTQKRQQIPERLWRMELLVFSLLMVLLASSIRSLAIGLDIMSATCAMAVMFFMPGLFLLSSQKSQCPRWSALARGFIAIGAVLSVVSAAAVVKESM